MANNPRQPTGAVLPILRDMEFLRAAPAAELIRTPPKGHLLSSLADEEILAFMEDWVDVAYEEQT